MRPLSLLLLTALILPTGAAALIGWWTFQTTIADAHHRGRQMALILREHALRVFEAQEAVIDTIDARIGGLSWDQIASSRPVHDLLHRLAERSPHVDGLWLIRPDGWTVNSADFFPMPPADVSNRPYFLALRERDELHLGQMIEGRVTRTLSFNIGRRRSSADNIFDGLITATIRLDYFQRFWHGVIGDDGHIISIVRSDGEILVRYPGLNSLPPRIPSASPFYQLVSTAQAGSFESRSLADGAERIYAFETLAGFPAAVVVGLNRAAVLAPWVANTAAIFTAAAVVSTILASLVLLAQRRERLLASEVDRRRRAETTLIAKEEHVAALERAEGARRESEERFRALFETLTQGVVVHGSSGEIISANHAAEQILGLDVHGLRARPVGDAAWEAVAADGRPLPPDEHPAMLALRTGEVVRGTTLGIRNSATGERRWLVVDAIPRLGPADRRPSEVFALVSDVTARRRGEEAQRLLVREVDHRAKNALAVVQALIRLTPSADPAGFVRSVEGRIGALARAHTLLARNRWEGADLRLMVEEELAPHRTGGGRIGIDGAALALAPDATQPVGMVLHELATNAAKHGALSAADGRLSVTWALRDDDGALVLRWRESGGPRVTAPARDGFGTKLMRANIGSQLKGQVSFDWNTDGLAVTIVIPAQHLQGVGIVSAAAAVPEGRIPADALRGSRILVAEDNAPIAMEMVDALTTLGCAVIGPATTLEEAQRLAASAEVDAAVLDVDLHGTSVLPAAETLAGRGIPVVFCTGFGEFDGAGTRWPDARIVRKPVSRAELTRALGRAITARHPVPGPAA